MKINWKVRLRSKKFWIALAALLGLIATDLGADAGKYEQYVQSLMVVLVAGGIITDPTTAGIDDSKQALSYQKPRKDDE